MKICIGLFTPPLISMRHSAERACAHRETNKNVLMPAKLGWHCASTLCPRFCEKSSWRESGAKKEKKREHRGRSREFRVWGARGKPPSQGAIVSFIMPMTVTYRDFSPSQLYEGNFMKGSSTFPGGADNLLRVSNEKGERPQGRRRFYFSLFHLRTAKTLKDSKVVKFQRRNLGPCNCVN